jgi:hypothetical protein
MFLRSLHKDFLNAAKAETRGADGRGISTEASNRAIEELWKKRLNERRRAFTTGRSSLLLDSAMDAIRDESRSCAS